MIYLNEKDIKKAISMEEMIDAIDLTYKIYHSGNFLMPTRTQIIHNHNTYLVMPSIIDDVIGTKLVTVFPNNTTLPIVQGIVIVSSNETGEIKAILDGTFLTGYRTGAVGGSAVRHLAKQDAQTVAIIGTGVQGYYQAIATCTQRPIKQIALYNRTEEKIPSFITKLKQEMNENIEIISYQSSEEAVKHADIIITATNSNVPVLPDNPHVLTNKLIIGIGSFQPTMREFPEALYEVAHQIFIDTEDAIKESGDLCIPLENRWIEKNCVQTLASLLHTKQCPSIKNEKSIIFKSTGMALFDAVTANMIYKKASKLGIGQRIQV